MAYVLITRNVSYDTYVPTTLDWTQTWLLTANVWLLHIGASKYPGMQVHMRTSTALFNDKAPITSSFGVTGDINFCHDNILCPT